MDNSGWPHLDQVTPRCYRAQAACAQPSNVLDLLLCSTFWYAPTLMRLSSSCRSAVVSLECGHVGIHTSCHSLLCVIFSETKEKLFRGKEINKQSTL